jgi:hypothetical protein
MLRAAHVGYLEWPMLQPGASAVLIRLAFKAAPDHTH